MRNILIYKDEGGYFASAFSLEDGNTYILTSSGEFARSACVKVREEWSFNSIRGLKRKFADAIKLSNKDRKNFRFRECL